MALNTFKRSYLTPLHFKGLNPEARYIVHIHLCWKFHHDSITKVTRGKCS